MPSHCPVCWKSLALNSERTTTDTVKIRCPKCGNFEISGSLLAAGIGKQKFSHKISSWISEQNNLGKTPMLRSEDISNIESQRDKKIKEKLDCFMLRLHKAQIGSSVGMDNLNYCYINGIDEFQTIVHYAESKKLINGALYPNGNYRLERLTFEGLEYIESLDEPNKNSKKVFCALNFTKELKDIFDKKIQEAINEIGFEYKRISSKDNDVNTKICDKVISEIKSSRFVIADFTGQRNAVYFEAGYAMGMDIPVIWTCKKDEVDKLSFDTRQYPHILWETAEDLASQIKDRLRALA